MPPRSPAAYLHPIDDAWRERVRARMGERRVTISELARRLQASGIEVTRSALHATLNTSQAASRHVEAIELELGLRGDAAVASPDASTMAHFPSTPVARGYEDLLLEISQLDDRHVPTVLALVRSLKARR